MAKEAPLAHSRVNTQRFTIYAQDPSVRVDGRPLMAQIDVPAELLSSGPCGYRVKVVDFDSSTGNLYKPVEYGYDKGGLIEDPFVPPDDDAGAAAWTKYGKLLVTPGFHQQNVYAIAMRMLARFEYALGRRVSWGFSGHQLHIAPHAFNMANAFYSEREWALLFGYFTPDAESGPVFACLAHDVVAHETTHALLDGLRDRYTEPSDKDQAGFHEGFSDVTAILSVFSLEEVVASVLTGQSRSQRGGTPVLPADAVKMDALANTALLGVAKQMGNAMSAGRKNALRRSVELAPSPKYLMQPQYFEAHSRGEILVAAFMRTFLNIWDARIRKLSAGAGHSRSLDLVVEEGAKVADHLLTSAIRALDYCPPCDLDFGDYLAALLTADRELVPDDSRFGYRKYVLDWFAAYGIKPPAASADTDGTWRRFDQECVYSRNHFESMLTEPGEVFRFIWENRDHWTVGGLPAIDDRGYTAVESVRACRRVGPDGFILRETVAEYIQMITLRAGELNDIFGIERPQKLHPQRSVTLFGGGTLVFDEYGQVKYHIAKPLGDVERQSRRLQWLVDSGYFEQTAEEKEPFAALHRHRLRLSELDGEAKRARHLSAPPGTRPGIRILSRLPGGKHGKRA